MAKHRPYRFRNLISLFVCVVMLLSGFLTIVTFIILRGLRVLPPPLFATVWMPAVAILTANIVGSVANYFFVPKIVRPIESLIEGTRKVAGGDFSVRVESESLVGEVRELADSFNTMTKELGNTEIFRSDFIRSFSHEFKTPIVSIRGFAKQLKYEDLTSEEREQYCDIIIAESERLTNMAENILLLSRYENQTIPPEKKEYRLDEQLRDCMILLERQWEKKNLTLSADLQEICVVQNSEMLHHVWINLISNAIKFTPEGGKIDVRATQNGDSVAVVVRDSGIGMTSEEMRHIFDKCYQVDRSHSGSGNGLGLCIAKQICLLSGATISVRSEKGKGSAFTVVLPKR